MDNDESATDGQPSVLELLLASVRMVERDCVPCISFSGDVIQLLESYPELLATEVETDLAGREVMAESEEERQHLSAARQVLAFSRLYGPSALKEGVAPNSPAEEPQEPTAQISAFLSVADMLGGLFVQGGILSSSLAVAKAAVLAKLSNLPGVDRELAREHALQTFDPAWRVVGATAPDLDLGAIQFEMAKLWAERQLGDRENNIDRAIELGESALQIYRHKETSAADWAHISYLLAVMLQERTAGNREENIEHSLRCCEDALHGFTRDKVPYSWALTQHALAASYMRRQRGDRDKNIEAAISAFGASLEILTRDVAPMDWARNQANLACAYTERLSGERADNLRRAIEHGRAALDVYSKEQNLKELIGVRNNLSLTYDRLREEGYGDSPRATLGVDEIEHFNRRDWIVEQNALGVAHLERRGADRAENQELAMGYFETALEAMTFEEDPKDWALLHSNLAGVFLHRIRGDHAENLELALKHCEASLSPSLRDLDPRVWTNAQFNLAAVYLNRLRGDREINIETAIRAIEAVLALPTFDGTEELWGRFHTALGYAYSYRSRGDGHSYRVRVLGDRADNIERSIEFCKAAGEALTRDNPEEWTTAQINLGAAYLDRLVGDESDNQERAIECYEAALELQTRDKSPYLWALIQHNLSNVYASRILGVSAENIERAITCCQSALLVRTRNTNAYEWAMTNLNLGKAYLNRHWGDRSTNIESAIACWEDTLTVYTPEAVPFFNAIAHSNLANAYHLRLMGERSSNSVRALEHYERALPVLCLSNKAAAVNALTAKGRIERENGNEAKARSTWSEALRLREALLKSGASLETRSEMAQKSKWLTAQLALVELSLGLPCEAVATIERGRALALREALRLDDVWIAELSAEARDDVIAARERLNSLLKSPTAVPQGFNPGQIRAWERSVASAEEDLEQTLKRIGFVPPTPMTAVELIKMAPSNGAIVFIVAGPTSGAAIVIRAGCSGLTVEHVVSLPDANSDALFRMILSWLRARSKIPHNASSADDLLLALELPNAVLEGVLDELWARIMRPILSRAAELGIPNESELVLVPLGEVALLPLHAAGQVVGGVRRTVLDDYVISYVPSGAALQTARRRLKSLSSELPNSLLGLFDPLSGTLGELPLAERVELPALRELFGASARTYAGSDASVERLLAEAGYGLYIHLACHGVFDHQDPLQSGLLLAGGQKLTVSTIVQRLKLSTNRCVTLSACETALVDVIKLPDEFVGLPAAFLQVGAIGVMATLWSVYDRPTADLIPRFYEGHLKNGLSPAEALRKAVLWLKRGGSDDGASGLAKSELAFQSAAHEYLVKMPIIWAAYSYHGL